MDTEVCSPYILLFLRQKHSFPPSCLGCDNWTWQLNAPCWREPPCPTMGHCFWEAVCSNDGPMLGCKSLISLPQYFFLCLSLFLCYPYMLITPNFLLTHSMCRTCVLITVNKSLPLSFILGEPNQQILAG